MTEVYLGQIMMTGYNFATKGSAMCNGQLLPLQQNQALFALLGVTYGGNGTSNFALPNMQGRTPVGWGSSLDPAWQPAPYPIGMPAGVENVQLLVSNLPQHTHPAMGTTTTGASRAPNVFGAATGLSPYAPTTTGLTALAANTLSAQGGNQPHANMQPFSVINFNIMLSGVFPSRN